MLLQKAPVISSSRLKAVRPAFFRTIRCPLASTMGGSNALGGGLCKALLQSMVTHLCTPCHKLAERRLFEKIKHDFDRTTGL